MTDASASSRKASGTACNSRLRAPSRSPSSAKSKPHLRASHVDCKLQADLPGQGPALVTRRPLLCQLPEVVKQDLDGAMVGVQQLDRVQGFFAMLVLP